MANALSPLSPLLRYKGKWHPALISNPAYKGKWKPRRVPNPEYYHDADPFARMTAIGAVGIELWSMSSDIHFDNVLITDDMDVATGWAGETFELKVSQVSLYRVSHTIVREISSCFVLGVPQPCLGSS